MAAGRRLTPSERWNRALGPLFECSLRSHCEHRQTSRVPAGAAATPGSRAPRYFQGGPVPFYFVKVTNLSSARDVVITHVWFEAAPTVHPLLRERPLPQRLRPDETWEAWIPAADLAHPRRRTVSRVLSGGIHSHGGAGKRDRFGHHAGEVAGAASDVRSPGATSWLNKSSRSRVQKRA